MNLNCKPVIENLSLQRNPDLTCPEAIEQKKHPVACPTCQKVSPIASGQSPRLRGFIGINAAGATSIVRSRSVIGTSEDLLYTAAVLENLPQPVPPPSLVAHIQARIRRAHRHSRWNFFANPTRILIALKMGPHPTVVQYTAILFYLMLILFLITHLFVRPTGPAPVVRKPLPPHTQVTQLGALKRTTLQRIRIARSKAAEEKSKEVLIKPE